MQKHQSHSDESRPHEWTVSRKSRDHNDSSTQHTNQFDNDGAFVCFQIVLEHNSSLVILADKVLNFRDAALKYQIAVIRLSVSDIARYWG